MRYDDLSQNTVTHEAFQLQAEAGRDVFASDRGVLRRTLDPQSAEAIDAHTEAAE
jgi:hypothetical protein